MSLEAISVRDQIYSRGWLVVESHNVHYATRGGQTTTPRQTLEAVLEDVDRLGCHGLSGTLAPNGERAKQTLKTDYSCNSVSSRGPVAEGSGAVLDWFSDHLQILVFDCNDDPALHVRLNTDGTIAEIVMRSRDLLRLCTFEGEPRVVSEWEKARDGV